MTHGGVLDIVNRFVRGNPLELPRDFHIPNTGLNWVRRRRKAGGSNPGRIRAISTMARSTNLASPDPAASD